MHYEFCMAAAPVAELSLLGVTSKIMQLLLQWIQNVF